jgi:hypothetical protein
MPWSPPSCRVLAYSSSRIIRQEKLCCDSCNKSPQSFVHLRSFCLTFGVAQHLRPLEYITFSILASQQQSWLACLYGYNGTLSTCFFSLIHCNSAFVHLCNPFCRSYRRFYCFIHSGLLYQLCDAFIYVFPTVILADYTW